MLFFIYVVASFVTSFNRYDLRYVVASDSWKVEENAIRTLAKAVWGAGVGVWIGTLVKCFFLATKTLVVTRGANTDYNFPLLVPFSRRGQAVSWGRNPSGRSDHGAQCPALHCLLVAAICPIAELLCRVLGGHAIPQKGVNDVSLLPCV